jgi:secretion system chaperone SsaE
MVRLTNLEDVLCADFTGHHRDKLIGILRVGLPERPEKCPEQLSHAARAARGVIETLWARYHGASSCLLESNNPSI